MSLISPDLPWRRRYVQFALDVPANLDFVFFRPSFSTLCSIELLIPVLHKIVKHRLFVLFISSRAAVDCWQSFDVPSATASAEA